MRRGNTAGCHRQPPKFLTLHPSPDNHVLGVEVCVFDGSESDATVGVLQLDLAFWGHILSLGPQVSNYRLVSYPTLVYLGWFYQ